MTLLQQLQYNWLQALELHLADNMEHLEEDVISEIRLLLMPFLAVKGRLPDPETETGKMNRVASAFQYYATVLATDPLVGPFPTELPPE